MAEGAQPPAPDAGHPPPRPPGPRRRRRRRSSGSSALALLTPSDIPDDAEGRVSFLDLSPPVESEPLPPEPEEASAPARPPRLRFGSDLTGWLPVLGLAVLLVVVFAFGNWVAR